MTTEGKKRSVTDLAGVVQHQLRGTNTSVEILFTFHGVCHGAIPSAASTFAVFVTITLASDTETPSFHPDCHVVTIGLLLKPVNGRRCETPPGLQLFFEGIERQKIIKVDPLLPRFGRRRFASPACP